MGESILSILKKRWKERHKRLEQSIQIREKFLEERVYQLMRMKDDVELARAERSKILRSLIRLKHSIEADREINQVLSESMLDFDAALQNGELKQLSIGDILDATKTNND